jgi:lipopolysaccharide export system permease protein
VKGQNAKSNILLNLPYVDKVNHRVWFFQSLDTRRETAKGLAITQSDADGHDVQQYIANAASWNGEFWQLSGVKEIVYNPDNSVQSQKIYEQIDLPDMTTPPKLIALIVAQPEQLTLAGLSQYIATSTASPGHLAGYRTEWWYRVLYPFSLIILMLFALYHGTRTDRRGPVVGVVWAIVILMLYILLINGFIALGKHGRISPFLSVIAMQVVFGAIGLHLLALSNGWWWQLLEVGKRWQEQWAGDEVSERDDAG